MPEMTPAQLLAPEAYAVARFIDGEFAYISGAFGDLGRAQECEAEMRAFYDGDYRVVRIDHG